MSNCNKTTTPFKTGAKLRKNTNDEFVSAHYTSNNWILKVYISNTRPVICQKVVQIDLWRSHKNVISLQ